MPTPTQHAELKGMRTEAKVLLEKAQTLNKKALDEKRAMSTEEKAEFDKFLASHEELADRVSKLEDAYNKSGDEDEDEDEDGDDTDAQNDSERSLKTKKKALEKRAVPPDSQIDLHKRTDFSNMSDRERRSTAAYEKAFYSFFSEGKAGLANLPTAEKRAVVMDVDVKGGFMMLPTEISKQVLKKVDDLLPLMVRATNISLREAASLGVPTIEESGDDGEWTTEIATIREDDNTQFGRRELTPTPFRKRVLVSERLLRMANKGQLMSRDGQTASGLQAILVNRIAYTMARTKEIGFTVGNGRGQPLGAFINSTRGISSARDVLTGSTNNFTYAGLLAAEEALKAQYRTKAVWLLHRAGLRRIKGLVDTAGRPLINFQTIPNSPTKLMDYDIVLGEQVPSAFVNGAYVGLLGDLEFYWTAETLDIMIESVNELYKERGMVGFFATSEVDGMPTLEEAFVRMICGV